jgi:hypothetical protein
MHPEIEKLIDLALADGQITEKERNVILKKAADFGVDADEVEMTLDGRFHQLQANQTKPNKEKVGNLNICPSCGSSVNSFQTKCSDCGHEFRNVQTNSSIKDLMTELKKIKKTNFKEDDGDIDEEEYFKARAEVIRNFAIPSTKEDLIEFATKSIAEFKEKEIDYDELNSAWASKAEEAISKLVVFSNNDSSLVSLIALLEKNLNIKQKRNKINSRKSAISTAILLPFAFFVGYLMYAFIFSLFGKLYWPFK